MKKLIMIFLAFFCLMAGCASTKPGQTDAPVPGATSPAAEADPPSTAVPETEAPSTAAPVIVSPLPQTIDLNALDNCRLAVSLAEGDAYVDDEGAMQMKVTVYTYDRYDMADIAALSTGDTLLLRGEEVKISSLEKLDSGAVIVNDTLELRTREDGTYYVTEANDHPAYYALGEAVIRVSPDFVYTDSSQPGEEKTFYPGDFLVEGTGIDYDFTPYNTTIRIENGRILEMHRIYIP